MARRRGGRRQTDGRRSEAYDVPLSHDSDALLPPRVSAFEQARSEDVFRLFPSPVLDAVYPWHPVGATPRVRGNIPSPYRHERSEFTRSVRDSQLRSLVVRVVKRAGFCKQRQDRRRVLFVKRQIGRGRGVQWFRPKKWRASSFWRC